VDDETRVGLAQGQGLFERHQHEFGRHVRGQVPAHDTPRAGIAPGGQVAPAPTHERQVGDVAHYIVRLLWVYVLIGPILVWFPNQPHYLWNSFSV